MELRRAYKRAALIGVAVVIGAGLALLLWNRAQAQPKRSAEAIHQEVLSQYDGVIESTVRDGNTYRLRLRSDTGLYEITVRADGSGIEAITRLESHTEPSPADSVPKPSATPIPTASPEPRPTPSPSPPPAGSPSPAQAPVALLPASEASKRALKKVNGTVQEVELKRSNGTWYYIVEIETPDGLEADVQVHAASGKIMSITWDDEDEDDDREDND